jgi:hypothetical protein
MKIISRFSLALIMFSLFSISYLVTLASAQDGQPNCIVNPDDGICYDVGSDNGQQNQGNAGNANEDSLMVAPGMSGAAITGSDSVVCGGFDNKVMAEINCLRAHLDTTPFRSKSRSSNGLGNYRCVNRKDRHQQVNCLRNILDGNGLAPGTN